MHVNIVALAGLVTALMSIGSFFFVFHKILNRFEKLEARSEKRKQENILLIKSVLAICDGLRQLGANGIVTKTKEELQDYIIKN